MVSAREILSHGGLRKGNRDIKGSTGFYRSPGIAAVTTGPGDAVLVPDKLYNKINNISSL